MFSHSFLKAWLDERHDPRLGTSLFIGAGRRGTPLTVVWGDSDCDGSTDQGHRMSFGRRWQGEGPSRGTAVHSSGTLVTEEGGSFLAEDQHVQSHEIERHDMH